MTARPQEGLTQNPRRQYRAARKASDDLDSTQSEVEERFTLELWDKWFENDHTDSESEEDDS